MWGRVVFNSTCMAGLCLTVHSGQGLFQQHLQRGVLFSVQGRVASKGKRYATASVEFLTNSLKEGAMLFKDESVRW